MLIHVILTTPCKLETVIVPILQMRKLKPREIIAKSHIYLIKTELEFHYTILPLSLFINDMLKVSTTTILQSFGKQKVK